MSTIGNIPVIPEATVLTPASNLRSSKKTSANQAETFGTILSAAVEQSVESREFGNVKQPIGENSYMLSSAGMAGMVLFGPMIQSPTASIDLNQDATSQIQMLAVDSILTSSKVPAPLQALNLKQSAGEIMPDQLMQGEQVPVTAAVPSFVPNEKLPVIPQEKQTVNDNMLLGPQNKGNIESAQLIAAAEHHGDQPVRIPFPGDYLAEQQTHANPLDQAKQILPDGENAAAPSFAVAPMKVNQLQTPSQSDQDSKTTAVMSTPKVALSPVVGQELNDSQTSENPLTNTGQNKVVLAPDQPDLSENQKIDFLKELEHQRHPSQAEFPAHVKNIETESVVRDHGHVNSGDPYEVMKQIVDKARFVNKANNSEMIVKLKPEHLGELTLKVTVENGVISAAFVSTNQEVRGILEASLPQLKQELSNQGLKVDTVGVYTGLSQFFANDRQSATPQQPIKFKNRRDAERFEETVEALAAVSSADADGVDYRI